MSLRSLTIWIADISDFATFFTGIFVVLYTFRKHHYGFLAALLLFSGALKIVSVYLAYQSVPNMPFYHLIGLIELTFIYLLYQQRNKLHLFWHLLASGVMLTYILNSLLIQSIYQVNNLALAINQLFVLILGFHFLAGIYQKNEVPDIGRYPFFYINAGFMLYAAGAFFVYLLSSRIFEEDPSDFFHSAWIMESVFNLFRLILVCIGVIYTRRE